MMQIRQLSATDQAVRLECEGQVTQSDLTPGVSPIEAASGPDVYRKPTLLSLEKTSYIDSSGVGWLLTARKKFEQAGGRLILHSIPPLVFQVLQVLRLTNVFTIATDENAALELAKGVQS
jgi:anti-sigma B factor antagonist